jgi:CRP-like cAMP-binding protein
MDAIEKGVCERLACERLVDVPILRGLPEPLRVRAVLTLHWLAQRVRVPDGAGLFEQETLCGGTGFLLLHGCVELRIAGRLSQELHPPSVLGVMPDFDPETRWTATATAKGDTELLKFSWLNYITTLRQRLSPEELDQLRKSVAAARDECFVR